ncbi:hypothetical protein [Nocardioides montaniterrae]
MISSVVACLGIVAFSFQSLVTFGAALWAHRRGEPQGLVVRMVVGAVVYLGLVVCCVLLVAHVVEPDSLWTAICVLLGLRVLLTWIRLPGERLGRPARG